MTSWSKSVDAFVSRPNVGQCSSTGKRPPWGRTRQPEKPEQSDDPRKTEQPVKFIGRVGPIQRAFSIRAEKCTKSEKSTQTPHSPRSTYFNSPKLRRRLENSLERTSGPLERTSVLMRFCLGNGQGVRHARMAQSIWRHCGLTRVKPLKP